MPMLLTLLIWVIVAGLIFSVLWWAISQISLPPPFAQVARAILVLAIVICLIYVLLTFVPLLPHR